MLFHLPQAIDRDTGLVAGLFKIMDCRKDRWRCICIETIAPEHVAIGMRVELRVEIGSDADMPVPVFHPMEIAA